MSLTTERTRLDVLGPEDLEPFTRIHSLAEVNAFLSPSRPLTPGESFRLFCQILGHAQVKGFGYWAVRRRSDEVWLGMVGLWFPEGWPGVELGWRFFPEFWGQGYASEAALAVRDHALAREGLSELISIIHSGNNRSVRLAERLGMLPWKGFATPEAPLIVFRWTAP